MSFFCFQGYLILVCYVVLLQSLLWEVDAFGHVLFQKEGVFCLKAWPDKGFYNSILSS